jgi:drug/metabolite transporter (DMT)-like permease
MACRLDRRVCRGKWGFENLCGAGWLAYLNRGVAFVLRANGLGLAISLSAVFQLIAISAMAMLVFGERPTGLQLGGMALGVVAVLMIAWPGAKT